LKLKLAGPGVQLQELARDDIDLVAAFGDEHQLVRAGAGTSLWWSAFRSPS